MQRGDWGVGGRGEEGKCIHGLTSESGMQHTFISRELLLCHSGIGAAQHSIDKYLTAPGVAARYCTLFLDAVAPLVACSPCSRSKSNLTAAAYHLDVCVWDTHSSYCTAPRSPTRMGRHVHRQIGSDQKSPAQTGKQQSLPVPGPVVNKCRGNDPVDLQRGKE